MGINTQIGQVVAALFATDCFMCTVVQNPLTRINNQFDMHTVLLQKSITLTNLNMCIVLNITSFW